MALLTSQMTNSPIATTVLGEVFCFKEQLSSSVFLRGGGGRHLKKDRGVGDREMDYVAEELT